MTYRMGVLTGAAVAILLAGSVVAGWWLVNGKPFDAAKLSPPPIPANVPKLLKEDNVNAIVLTVEGEARLAIKLGTISRKATGRTRVYGGEVTVPAGQTILVTAPLSGTLFTPSAGVPTPGSVVSKGQPVFQLRPILTPEGRATLATTRVEADGQVKNAQAQLDAAQIALGRAKNLLRDEAGSQRMVDEAQAQVELAMKTMEAATARRDLLTKVLGDMDGGTTATIAIDCPADGILRSLSARPGQTVPPGAALFEVVDPSRVWVRVPVYVGDLPEIDPKAEASIGNLSGRPGGKNSNAKAIPAPPSANVAAGTVDLFYELDNRTAKYSPGHRIGATLALVGPSESSTVPWSAVVHDFHGGTWVYERTGERAYARRRVVVRSVQGDAAVLDSGPPEGTTVVTAGAAELFGTETGFSK